MLKQLDREALRAIVADINAALAPVAAKHGIALNVGRSVFTASSATIKVEAAVRGAGADADASARDLKAAQDWEGWHSILGLQKEWLGKSFVRSADKGAWRIVGILPNSRKYPVLVHNAEQGKYMRFPAESICVYMQLPANRKQGA